jgi:distribution and morphology protein 12
MSIDINWQNLTDDLSIAHNVLQLLNDQFANLELPDFLQNLKAIGFSLGTIPPEITIRHIGDPFPEFVEAVGGDGGGDEVVNSDDGTTNANADTSKDDTGIQFLVELEYKGNMSIEFQVDLLLNYPSPGFIKLPVKLKLCDLGIHSLAVISHIKKQVFISLLCDINDDSFDEVLQNPTRNKRIDIIRSIRIENEIGDDLDGSVLRNVGKVEKFLVELMRGLLRDELGWPGWISLDFSDGDESDDDDDD